MGSVFVFFLGAVALHICMVAVLEENLWIPDGPSLDQTRCVLACFFPILLFTHVLILCMLPRNVLLLYCTVAILQQRKRDQGTSPRHDTDILSKVVSTT